MGRLHEEAKTKDREPWPEPISLLRFDGFGRANGPVKKIRLKKILS
jgi:hypothetical protein